MQKQTVLITGGSQGIGQAIAFRFAREGAQLVIISNDRSEQIEETRRGIVEAGGQALFCDVDVRDIEQIQRGIAETLAHFGQIDILVNNTSAPCFADTFHISVDELDLAFSTSTRAAFLISRACFPHLKKAKNPHIINIAPPLNLEVEWLRDFLPFSIGKYGMSLCTKGMAAEFKDAKIAVNSLWPQTNIATQRLKDYLAPHVYAGSRWPSIMADAALLLASFPAAEISGRFFIDEELLREAGITDFSEYAVDATKPLVQTLFLPLKEGMIPISKDLFRSSK